MPETPNNPTPQQPVQPQQVPQQPQAPYEQQPVEQQYFSQPNAAPVQYVITQQSLKGLRGWLMFFTIISGLAAITYIYGLVDAFANFSSEKITDIIFLPFLIAAAIASVVFVALEKKIAKYIFIGFYGVAYLYSIISTAITGTDAPELIAGILVGGLWVLIVSLYFLTSKRVKETLVK